MNWGVTNSFPVRTPGLVSQSVQRVGFFFLFHNDEVNFWTRQTFSSEIIYGRPRNKEMACPESGLISMA